MSKIVAYIDNDILHINKKGQRNYSAQNEKIAIEEMLLGFQYSSKIKSTNDEQKYTILLEQKVYRTSVESTLIVFIKVDRVYYYIAAENIYGKLVSIKSKVLKISLSNRKFKIHLIAYILNPFNLVCNNGVVSIGGSEDQEIKLKQYKNTPAKFEKITKNVHVVSYNLRDEIDCVSEINNLCKIKIKINGTQQESILTKKDKKIKDKRLYYVPMMSIYLRDYAIQVRRSLTGSIVFVKRKRESIEYNFKFKVLESPAVALVLKLSARVYKKIRKKTINLYYEKFASKAEEGAFDLFQMTAKSTQSKNYFVINPESGDYQLIKNEKNIVKQFSLKFYWLFYCADNLIATESQSQLGIIRGNNIKFRKELINKKNVFLQHGIIYLKNLGKLSPYYKGREGSCDYIVASSQKESEVICEMLNMKESEVLVTGLGIFSKVKYKHIGEESRDIVTIMLTWKPYEEHFEDFTKSTYYKNTMEIYKIVSLYIDSENINIVAHPKVEELLKSTDLGERMWKGKISEVLTVTKLLITDYSSVCYNAFYQGAGVIFVHDDIDIYEQANGEMIPQDNEYIGERVFEVNELIPLLSEVIDENKIKLSRIRTGKHEKIYSTINEFNDGRNIHRIYNRLVELEII